jgi:hypothetical protein
MFQPLGPLQPTIPLLVVFAVVLLLSGFALFLGRIKIGDPAVKILRTYLTFGQWPTFFARFGLMQVAVCTLSMLLAGVAMAVRPADAVKTMVQELIVSPSDANPSVVNVAGSPAVTIHATAEPAGSAATLLISDAKNASGPVRRLSVTSGKWTAWQGSPDAEQLHISAAKPDDLTVKNATAVKVLVTTRRGAVSR